MKTQAQQIKLDNGDILHISTEGKYKLDWGYGEPDTIVESEAKECVKKHAPKKYSQLFGQPWYEGEYDETRESYSPEPDYIKDF